MKNASLKKILTTILGVALILSTIFVISSCQKKEEAHEHEFYEQVLTEPNCLSDGVSITKCKGCDYGVEHVVKALGHSYTVHKAYEATCTEDGCQEWRECKKCGYSEYSQDKVIAARGYHSPKAAVKENIVAATCLDDGSYDSVVYCEDCYNREAKKPASQRNYKNAELSRETVAVTALGHSLKHVDGVHPTCQPGWYEYDQCTRCSYNTKVTLDPVYEHVREASGRVEVTKAPTCTEPGKYDVKIYCVQCKQTIETEQSDIEIAPLGHDLVDHAAKAPTCTTVGWSDYQTCDRCDYSTYAENEIACLDHDLTNHIAQAPTCTEPGWDAYVTCGREGCNYNTINYVDAIGHTPGTVQVDQASTVQPTCLEDGKYYFCVSCTVCGEELSRDEKVTPALGHDLVDHAAKAPTCTEFGWDEYVTCRRCDYTTLGAQIPANGHSEVEHDAKEPTCLEIGWDAYVTCNDCSYTTYVEKAALDHDITNHTAKAPTCVAIGWEAYETCSRCDLNTYVELPALGEHIYSETNGYCTYNCGARISVGLSYVKNSDGTYTVAGKGNCADTEIIIPDFFNGQEVVAIADEAFMNNKSITSVVIGNNVETIGKRAFYYCSNLASVTIGSSVTTIVDQAFNACDKLSTVYYKGTAAKWNEISIDSLNAPLTNANRKYI